MTHHLSADHTPDDTPGCTPARSTAAHPPPVGDHGKGAGRRGRLRARLGDDRGSFLVWIPTIALIAIALVGLSVDGAGQLSTARRATAVAQEAARAGANAVDADTGYAGTGAQINIGQARIAATDYLTDAGMTGSVTMINATTLQVTVNTAYRPRVLSFTAPWAVTATASADLQRGITQEAR